MSHRQRMQQRGKPLAQRLSRQQGNIVLGLGPSSWSCMLLHIIPTACAINDSSAAEQQSIASARSVSS